jgi:hypothetical protein
MVGAPLAVWAGLREPQLEPWQLAAQSTPAFVGSLVTIAVRARVAPGAKEEGGDCARVIEIGGGVIFITAVAVLLVSAVAVAMMVTVPVVGGAV